MYMPAVGSINPAFKKRYGWYICRALPVRCRKRCFLLAERTALVKQASAELGGCQTHMKQRSISPPCVRPLIDEAGEGAGLSLFQMVLPQNPPEHKQKTNLSMFNHLEAWLRSLLSSCEYHWTDVKSEVVWMLDVMVEELVCAGSAVSGFLITWTLNKLNCFVLMQFL